jgi:hypothetical protein
MLTCIPPKSSGDIYVGASSGYKPAKIMYNSIDKTIIQTGNILETTDIVFANSRDSKRITFAFPIDYNEIEVI